MISFLVLILLLCLYLLCVAGVMVSGNSISNSITNSSGGDGIILNTTTTTMIPIMMINNNKNYSTTINKDHIIINNDNNHPHRYYHIDDNNTINNDRKDAVVVHTMMQMTEQRSLSTPISDCIHNFDQLQSLISDLVNQVPSFMKMIDICMSPISFDETIILSNKWLHMRCINQNSNNCIFDGQNKSRHFIITSSSYIIFENMIFQNGMSSRSSSIDNDDGNNGGSLYINNKSTVQLLLNCTFINNKALNHGGAISIMNYSTIFSTTSLSITTTNTGTKPIIINNNDSTNTDNIIIFENNIAINKDGGVIYANDNSNIYFSNPKSCIIKFVNNEAFMGGVIKAENKCNTIIQNAKFYRNKASHSGGALHMIKNTSTQLIKVEFESNKAIKNGAAIAYEDGELIMDDVQLLDNEAINGTISLTNTAIKMNNVRSGTEVGDSCDTFFSLSKNTNRTWKYSCVNLPSPSARREIRYQRRQVVENPRLLGSRCVTTDRELRDAVLECDSRKLRRPCRVDVCSRKIRITRPASPSRTRSLGSVSNITNGIDVSDKEIIIGCLLPCPSTERCVLDGGGETRIFYGNNTNITIENMILANGYDSNSGSAIKIEINSIVTLSNCLFINNSAPKTGSAISVSRTELYANKIETKQNVGNGTPIQGYSSNLAINNALLLGNVNAPSGGGGILMFDSKIKVKNVTSGNTTLSKNCDVVVAAYGDDDPLTDSTCLQLTTLSSVSVKDPVQCFSSSSAPTPSPPTILKPPTPSPPTTTSPDHQICFSSNNNVEVKERGYILMSQLMIGDFVKSSMSDQFTQAYGFGHLDHHREGVFLQICFDQTCSNGMADDVSSLILEISSRHLVMVNRNHKQNYIPASDVVVGDVLSEKIVTKIQAVIRQGVYAPLTQSGDIVVSGVAASNYVQLVDDKILKGQQHNLGHAIFLPQRLFCTYYVKICRQERYINGYGYTAYIIVRGSAIMNQKAIFAMGAFLVFICFIVRIVQRVLSRKEFIV